MPFDLKNYLQENKLTPTSLNEGVMEESERGMKKAKEVILKAIKKNKYLKTGKIKIEDEVYYSKGWRGHIFGVKVLVEEDGEKYSMVIKLRSIPKERENEVHYKAFVFESSGMGEYFKDEKKLLQWLDKEIRNFEFMGRISLR